MILELGHRAQDDDIADRLDKLEGRPWQPTTGTSDDWRGGQRVIVQMPDPDETITRWPPGLRQAAVSLRTLTGSDQSSSDFAVAVYASDYLAAFWPDEHPDHRPEHCEYQVGTLERERRVLVARGDWPDSDPGYQVIKLPTCCIDGSGAPLQDLTELRMRCLEVPADLLRKNVELARRSDTVRRYS